MDVDAVLEPYIGDTVTTSGLAMGRGAAARERQCDRGHNNANGIERDQGYRTIKAHFGNKPAQHAAFTSGSISTLA
jgi:hypothetical protein